MYSREIRWSTSCEIYRHACTDTARRGDLCARAEIHADKCTDTRLDEDTRDTLSGSHASNKKEKKKKKRGRIWTDLQDVEFCCKADDVTANRVPLNCGNGLFDTPDIGRKEEEEKRKKKEERMSEESRRTREMPQQSRVLGSSGDSTPSLPLNCSFSFFFFFTASRAPSRASFGKKKKKNLSVSTHVDLWHHRKGKRCRVRRLHSLEMKERRLAVEPERKRNTRDADRQAESQETRKPRNL